MAYLFGIDMGTSSLKTMLCTTSGGVVAESARKYRFDIPANGYAQQDPQVWWSACCEAVGETLAKSGVVPAEVAAVAISGQMHGTVLLDEGKNVIRPVILHCDARSAIQCRYIKKTLGESRLRSLVMNPIFSGFMLPSLLWVRDNEPHNYAKISYAMLPKDYIRYKLTGTIASEYSDASATLLFDIGKGEWSRELLDIFNINPDILPRVYETTEIAGAVTGAAAEATGFAPGTPLVYGGGDQIMQAIGNGVIADGMATVNIGSSGQICFPSEKMKVNPHVTSNLFCGYRKNQWISMAATMSAGLSLAWWNNLIAPTDWKDLDVEVEKIPPGSGGLLFLPYLGGERSPHLNPDLSGSFVGLTHGTTHHRMTRAVMEGVTFALYDCVNICTEMGLKAEYMVASGGGANSVPWLKMQADIFNVPLKIAENHEQAALGAAITAGVGCGIFKDIAQGCDAMVRYKERIIEPDAKNHETYLQYYDLFKAAFATQKDVIEKLTRLGRSS